MSLRTGALTHKKHKKVGLKKLLHFLIKQRNILELSQTALKKEIQIFVTLNSRNQIYLE